LRHGNVFGLKWEPVDLARRIAWIYPYEGKADKAIGVPLNQTAIQVLSERLGRRSVYVLTNSV
ncbi:tyrosine-type recombinase/integrase, partial [Kingella kingae]|uniref:tyrosine-type recombinase/integrase n=1 Tax=Kingella kingae TaxID=504 RepID=UPI001E571E04